MWGKLFGTDEYRLAKTQLKNFSNELKAVGSKQLSNGDLMRFRDRYKRIVRAKTKKNISQREHRKLEIALEEFRERFKYLGFIDDMEPFMAPSIPELSSDSVDLPRCETSEPYYLRSRRKRSDDEKNNRREDYGSGATSYSDEYYRIKAQLESIIIHLETVSNSLSSNDVKEYQSMFRDIGEAIYQMDPSTREFKELSDLYSERTSRFKHVIDKVRRKSFESYDTKTSVTKNSEETEKPKQEVSYYGKWRKPSSTSTETRQHKSTDLPQIHSSGKKTEENESCKDLSMSSSGSSLQNKSIEWEMLANETKPNRDGDHSDITFTQEKHMQTAFSKEDTDTKGEEHKRPKETTAEVLRRNIPRTDDLNSVKVSERISKYQEKLVHNNQLIGKSTSTKHNINYRLENERKAHQEYRREIAETCIHEAHKKENQTFNFQRTQNDLKTSDTAGIQQPYNQGDYGRYNNRSRGMGYTHRDYRDPNHEYIYSAAFSGRGRTNTYAQYPMEQRRDLGERDPRYQTQYHNSKNCSQIDKNKDNFRGRDQHFSSHRLEDTESKSQNQSNRRSPVKGSPYDQNQEKTIRYNYSETDRSSAKGSPYYDQNQDNSLRCIYNEAVVEVAQEVKEEKEEALEILDVHKYFRDDFDVNSVDSLDNNIDKIDTIDQYAKTFESKVNSFDGDLLEFFVVDEKLMRLIEKLDKIKCQDDQKATEKKVELIEYIKGLHTILDERAKDD